MGPYLGDFKAGSILYFTWDTNDGNGASINPSIAGTISVYKDDNVVQSVAGITDVRAFDGLVGVHNCRIDTSNVFYAAGHDYSVVLSAATIDTQVVNATLATFSIENRNRDISALAIANIWDDIQSAATHDIAESAGRRLRNLSVATNTAQAGAANSIQFAVGELATDHIFNQSLVYITKGLGAGQVRRIMEYDGATKIAVVNRAWDINPNNTSEYVIIPFSDVLVSNQGIAQAGSPTTIRLAVTASAVNNYYIGEIVYIASGAGSGQARIITGYVGGTTTATIYPAWSTNPDNTSVYKVMPIGPAMVDAVDPTLLALALGGFWDEVLSPATHDVIDSAGRRLRNLFVTTGTAQSGAANSIQLAVAEPATDRIYNQNLIYITKGLGAGQVRLVMDYIGTTKIAILNRAWDVIPNNTSEYAIISREDELPLQQGIAQSGSLTTIRLATTASAADDYYLGSTVYIAAGTGAGQARIIIGYVGATNTATIYPAWTIAPDNTSVYKVFPFPANSWRYI